MRTAALLLLALPLMAAAEAPDLTTPTGRRELEAVIRGGATNAPALKAAEQDLIRALRSTNATVVLFAGQQLAAIGTDKAVDTLAAALAKRETAHAACLALAASPSKRAGEVLVAGLAQSEGAVRLQILHALGTRGEQAAVPAVAKLASGIDPETAEAAALALARIPGREARRALDALPGFAAAKLERAERDRDARAAAKFTEPGLPPNIRRGALALELRLDPDRANKRIVAVVQAGDLVLSPVAIAAVESLSGRGVSRQFAALLPGLAPELQAYLIAALAGRGDPDAREAVRDALRSPHLSVRSAAVAAARRLEDVAAVPGLLVNLARADDAEARAIEEAILALPAGPGLNAALLASLEGAGGERARLIRLIARCRVPGAAPVLLQHLSSLDAAGAKAALQAVGQVAAVSDLPALLTLLGTNEAAEPAAARALGRIPDEAGKAHVLREAYAKAATPAAKAALIRLLPKAATAEALQDVQARLQDGDAALRGEAVRALANWPDCAGWEPLVSVYAAETDDTLRVLALRGLARLAALPGESVRLVALLSSARNDEDRKVLIAAIGASGDPRLLPALAPLLVNPAVKAEAEAARTALTRPDPAAKPLFDGQTLQGWEGDTTNTWRVENGAIVAGSLEQKVPANQYLATTREFANFDLQLQYRLTGTEGFVNGGVQFRSVRLPDPRGMSGYQADLGMGYDGALYDEHRRDKFLVRPEEKVRDAAMVSNGWNFYRIRAEGPRVRIWLNGALTVDYTESDASIPQKGVIAVQIHGGGKARVEYRELSIMEL